MHTTQGAAYKAKADIAREYWDDRPSPAKSLPDDPSGLDDDTVVDAYLDGNEREFFDISERDIDLFPGVIDVKATLEQTIDFLAAAMVVSNHLKLGTPRHLISSEMAAMVRLAEAVDYA